MTDQKSSRPARKPRTAVATKTATATATTAPLTEVATAAPAAAAPEASPPEAQIRITQLKPAPEPEAPPVVFESREREPSPFAVAGIQPIRNFSNGRLEWEVAADDVERFQRNHFVQMNRVIRKAV
jgi:hypothetical protein